MKFGNEKKLTYSPVLILVVSKLAFININRNWSLTHFTLFHSELIHEINF